MYTLSPFTRSYMSYLQYVCHIQAMPTRMKKTSNFMFFYYVAYGELVTGVTLLPLTELPYDRHNVNPLQS